MADYCTCNTPNARPPCGYCERQATCSICGEDDAVAEDMCWKCWTLEEDLKPGSMATAVVSGGGITMGSGLTVFGSVNVSKEMFCAPFSGSEFPISTHGSGTLLKVRSVYVDQIPLKYLTDYRVIGDVVVLEFDPVGASHVIVEYAHTI